MSTGFFGIPGKIPRGTAAKVHVVHQGHTLCGWKPSRDHRFQWCAHGIDLKMIECARCRTAAEKLKRLQLV